MLLLLSAGTEVVDSVVAALELLLAEEEDATARFCKDPLLFI